MPGDEQITIMVDDTEVEATVAKIETALGKKDEVDTVRDSADQASTDADHVNSLFPQISGASLLQRRVLTGMPQFREAYYLLSQIKLLMRVAPEVSALLVIWMVGRSVMSYLQQASKDAIEYRRMIMETAGLKTKEQYDNWAAEDKRRSVDAMRSAIPP